MIEGVETELELVDSLAVDSLAEVVDWRLVDSLAEVERQRVADSLRLAGEVAIFGEHSQLVESVGVEREPRGVDTIADGVRAYEVAALVVLALYLLWLKRRVVDSQRHAVDNTYSEAKSMGADVQRLFVGDNVLSYLLVVASFVLGSGMLLGRLDDWGWLWRLAVGWHLVVVIQILVLQLSSFLSYNESLFEGVMRMKIDFFTKIMVWSVPLTLILVMVNGLSMSLYVAVVQVIVVLCGYVFTSSRLFRSKKISILNWFLYLCAVELLPIALLWTVVMRSLV